MHDCIIEEHLTYVLRSLNSTDLTNTKKKRKQEPAISAVLNIEICNFNIAIADRSFCWLYSLILHSGHSTEHNIDAVLDFRIHAFKHLA